MVFFVLDLTELRTELKITNIKGAALTSSKDVCS